MTDLLLKTLEVELDDLIHNFRVITFSADKFYITTLLKE